VVTLVLTITLHFTSLQGARVGGGVGGEGGDLFPWEFDVDYYVYPLEWKGRRVDSSLGILVEKWRTQVQYMLTMLTHVHYSTPTDPDIHTHTHRNIKYVYKVHTLCTRSPWLNNSMPYKLTVYILQRLNSKQQKNPAGTRQTERKNLVWFGEIERKIAKLSMTTFTYRSSY
jgi:hypothetical protein